MSICEAFWLAFLLNYASTSAIVDEGRVAPTHQKENLAEPRAVDSLLLDLFDELTEDFQANETEFLPSSPAPAMATARTNSSISSFRGNPIEPKNIQDSRRIDVTTTPTQDRKTVKYSAANFSSALDKISLSQLMYALESQGMANETRQTVLQNLFNAITNPIQGLTNAFANGLQSAVSGVANGIQNGAQGFQNAIQGAVQGPKGDTGARGPTGPKGSKGETGSKGESGSQGLKGIPGSDTPAFPFTIGSSTDETVCTTILPFHGKYFCTVHALVILSTSQC